MNCTVTMLSQKIQAEVEYGTSLMDFLYSVGFAPEAPCGGNGTCKKCRVMVDGEDMLACRYLVCQDISVEIPEKGSSFVLTSGSMPDIQTDPVKAGYLAAFDLGTTTVVCFLLDEDGREAATANTVNPQTVYGADVVTRIQHALNGKMEMLTESIRASMEELLREVCMKAGISPQKISVISVVGNPCMQQLFLGIPPKNLAAVPFAPVITRAEVQDAAKYLPLCPNACLLIVPDISGYVGADTLACVIASGLYHTEDTVLLVDIGTNGEMVLSHEGSMAACATAAGPALEGAGIHFGMRGMEGAIDHVRFEDGKLQYHTIGETKPVGICGSGLIDAAAAMLDCGALNYRGRIQTEEKGQQIFRICDEIYLTQDDIGQIQLAKGAIAAGIRVLAHHFGIEVEEIDRILLAGAFGTFMSPESACRIHMLPPGLQGKITAVGNIAGSGAKILACDRSRLDLAQSLLEKIKYIELSAAPDFRRFFPQGMRF